MLSAERAIIGCLLGTAVGDALGLGFEGLSKKKQARMFPDIKGYHFFFGKGMVSDDTEHVCMLAQALIFSAGEPKAFVRKLSWNFRFWLLGLPAGVGYATLRSVLKLWLGFSGARSGVFSAGNGPAMRSPLIGVCYGDDRAKMRELVRCSTRITHTDPKAEFGALAVALAADMAARQPEVSARAYVEELRKTLAGEAAGEFLELIEKAAASVEHGESTESFAESLGLAKGVSGYVCHTVPAVIHCWLSHQNDFESGVKAIIRCGGDTDTTAAILGAIIASAMGEEGIPEEWLNNLWEWPRTKEWMRNLGKQLAEVCESGAAQQPASLPFYGIILRNIFFLFIIFCHILKRAFYLGR
ncbi:MAG: dinitrogenase reductase [Desulfobacteraceae bacterium IS3]|nr:MAG: dinitrogenase reductase [Desulfobacteraceae bacterium IS3]